MINLLKPNAFGNALALTTVLFYFVLWLLSSMAPALFTLVYNSQFLGSDASSLLPPTQDIGAAIVSLVVTGIGAWVMGYVIAYLYNRFAK